MMPSPNRPSSLSITVYILLGLSLWPTVPARAALIPRTPLPKPPYVLYPNDPSQMAIKFVDAMKAALNRVSSPPRIRTCSMRSPR